MPIYEFYCPDCHRIFNFLSRKVNTTGRPSCPRCRRRRLSRQVSLFAAVRGGGEDRDQMDDLPIDETKMERAMESLAGEAENINEDDPAQAARLMRKFSSMTGMKFGDGMETALNRMEAGEDPEKIEQEMGDLLDDEDPFVMSGGKKGLAAGSGRNRGEPARDPGLYEF